VGYVHKYILVTFQSGLPNGLALGDILVPSSLSRAESGRSDPNEKTRGQRDDLRFCAQQTDEGAIFAATYHFTDAACSDSYSHAQGSISH
jgi:hypothetical protein